MNDDLFSRLFELFDQPGPINWRLAAEVARHISGDYEPVEPWAAEEYRELARLAEFRVEEVAPFRMVPASDVLPLDGRAWAEKNLESYGEIVGPFASSVISEGPVASLMAQLTPAIVGLQAGSLVGSLSTWVLGSFDAGIPQQPLGPLTLIVPNISRFAMTVDLDDREVRLWVAANEVSFRMVSQIPWIQDHLHGLASEYADAVKIDPTRLGGMMTGGTDPASIEAAIEQAGGIEGLIGGEEAEGPRRELEAFLGAITGCARLLARRAIGELSPGFDRITATRDDQRAETSVQPTIGVGPVPVEATQLGDEFNQEVERRYGEDALETLWADPTRMPSASELRDPTGWAARVLLEGWG
jgi:putative hydrolase